MADSSSDELNGTSTSLEGTTYKVYRYILRQRRPVRALEVQRALRFSSPSVSYYHIRKLIQMKLIREEGNGYSVDRVVIENVIRIRRVSFPLQTAYVSFFTVTLAILLVFLRPEVIDSVYFLAVVVNGAAVEITSYETVKTLRQL